MDKFEKFKQEQEKKDQKRLQEWRSVKPHKRILWKTRQLIANNMETCKFSNSKELGVFSRGFFLETRMRQLYRAQKLREKLPGNAILPPWL